MTTQPRAYPLSLLTLALFPLSALAASPWIVTDGSTLQVTSDYFSTEQSDYPLYASGAGSHLITDSGLAFSTANTTGAVITTGAALTLNNATLLVSGNSADGIKASDGTVIVSNSTITMASDGNNPGNAIEGKNAIISITDSALAVSGQASTSVTLDGGTFYAGNVTISGSAESLSGGDLYLKGSASATLDNVQITHPHKNGTSTINIAKGTLEGTNVTIDSASLNYSAIIVGQGSSSTERSRLTLTDSTINNAFSGLLAMGGDMTLNNVDVTTRLDYAIAANVNMDSDTLIQGGSYTTSGAEAHGIWLASSDTTLDATDTTIATRGERAHAVNAQFGTATLKNSTLTTSGTSGYALSSAVNTTGSGLTIITSGNSGHGVVACSNSDTQSTLTLTDSTVSTTGDGALGAAGLAGTALVLSDITVATSGANSHALQVNAGKASLTDSILTTQGEKAYGLSTNGGDIKLVNTTFSTTGQASTGIYAYNSAVLSADTLNITTGGEKAYGLTAQRATIDINTGNVTSSGAASAGIYAFDAATVTADNLTLTVVGKEGYGVATDSSTLVFSNSILNAGKDSDTAATALLALDSQNAGSSSSVTLDNTSLISTGYGVKASGARLDLTLNNDSYLYGGNGVAVITEASANSAGSVVAAEINLTLDHSHILGEILAKSGTINVALNNRSLFEGITTNVNLFSVDSSSSWQLNGDASVNTLQLSGGSIIFGSDTTSKTLTIKNNLSGSGSFVLNTILGDDDSSTDRIVIEGNASGRYGVVINNGDGAGAATRVGIPVINVAGDAQSASFTLRNALVTGNYQYLLNKVSDHDWYLQSSLTPVMLSNRAALPESTSLATATSEAAAATATAASTSVAVLAYRPETAGFMIAPWLNANYGFTTVGSWHQRRDAYKSDTVWGKIAAAHDRYGAGRFAFDVNTAFVQFGGDLLQQDLANGWHLSAGPMATIGHQHSSNKDRARGIRPELSVDVGKNTTRAYGVGGYLTAFSDDGAYLSGITQVTRYDNEFSSLTSGKNHAFSLVLSAEAGLPVRLSGDFTLEPQLQASGQYLNVSQSNPGGVKLEAQDLFVGQLREGLRLSYDKTAVKPYLQADMVQWLARTPGVVMNNEILKPDVRRHHWQAIAGISGQLTPQLSASARVSYSHSFGSGLEGYSGNLGLEYRF